MMEHIPSEDRLQSELPEWNNITLIGSGGFKAVYKGEIEDREEAVKVALLPPEDDQGSRAQLIGRMTREIDVLSSCDTPYLVRIGSLERRTLNIGGHDYFVYSEELLPGEPLIELVKRQAVPSFEEITSLARCLIEALTEIAAQDHIHRDIKPHNIIATGLADRPFVLLDLGIAFKVHGTELTAPGAGPPGTMIYMAPELFRPNYKDILDIRSDIYSAGVTIFEFATGTHPLTRTGEDQYATLYRIMKQQPPRLEALRDDLPKWFCRMVDRCIKKTPALRFRSPKAFLDELENNL